MASQVVNRCNWAASWTTPELASFIESISERVPLWLCVRLEHRWDVGHTWLLLVRFERVQLKALHPGETLSLVETAGLPLTHVGGNKEPRCADPKMLQMSSCQNRAEWFNRHCSEKDLM